MSSQDIDKLELLADGINGIVDVGEEILEDGKIGFDDLQHSKELYEEVKKVVEAAKSYKELMEEAKDVDPAEAIRFVQVLLNGK